VVAQQNRFLHKIANFSMQNPTEKLRNFFAKRWLEKFLHEK